MKTFNDFITQAVQTHTEINKAVNLVIHLLDSHPDVRDAELRMLVAQAVRNSVHQAQGRTRSVAKRCSRGLAAIASAAPAKLASILDSWVLDGTRLGDFTGTELLPFVSTARNQAAGHLKNAAFYGYLARKAKGQKVRKAVTAEQAANRWTEIDKQDRAEAV